MNPIAFSFDPADTNAQIRKVIVRLDAARTATPGAVIGVTLAGYADDPRELQLIPEARAFARRLVALGVIAPLTPSMTVDPKTFRPIPPLALSLGAFELWALSEGLIRPDGTVLLDMPVVDRFGDAIRTANAKADVLTLVDHMSRTTLTDDQRINLAIKVVEYEQAEGRAELVARLAALIKYVAAERILAREIKKTDRGTDRLVPAITAATMFENPTDFPAGSLGGDALVAAGFACGPEDPDDEEPEAPRDMTSSPSDFPF
jgi:hypothetical protein